MQRAGMRSFARARALRFDWQKLVTPATSKAAVAEYQRKASEVNQMTQQAGSIAPTVESIDWEHWKTQIEAPGVVEEMQKEYEALNFPNVEAMSSTNVEKIAGIEEDILAAKKAAVLGASELAETDKALAQVRTVQTEGMDWELDKWYSFMPGMKEQHLAEFEAEDYLITEGQRKLETVDWKAAGEEFKQGVDPDIGESEENVGDMNTAEELELVAQGKWSVARIFASRDERAKILDKTEKLLASV